MKALLYLPIALMLTLGVFGMLGLGTSDPNFSGTFYYNPETRVTGYSDVTHGTTGTLYDAGGHGVCDYDLAPLGETGEVQPQESLRMTYAVWVNATNRYYIYSDEYGVDRVSFDGLEGATAENSTISNSKAYTIGTTFGFIALVVVMMALGSIAGIRILGSGTSEASVVLLIKGSFYLAIWGALTALSYQMILTGGFIVFILYMIMTIMYTLGIIDSTAGSGSND